MVILSLFTTQINCAMPELEIEFAMTRFRGPQDAQTPPAELVCPSASAMSTSRFGVDNAAESSTVAAERPERLDASYEPHLIGRECGWVQHIGQMLRVAARRRPIPCPSLSIWAVGMVGSRSSSKDIAASMSMTWPADRQFAQHCLQTDSANCFRRIEIAGGNREVPITQRKWFGAKTQTMEPTNPEKARNNAHNLSRKQVQDLSQELDTNDPMCRSMFQSGNRINNLKFMNITVVQPSNWDFSEDADAIVASVPRPSTKREAAHSKGGSGGVASCREPKTAEEAVSASRPCFGSAFPAVCAGDRGGDGGNRDEQRS
jgi:hypothetical protein